MPAITLRLIYLSICGAAGWLVAGGVERYLRSRDYSADFPNQPRIKWGDIDEYAWAAGFVTAALVYWFFERRLRLRQTRQQRDPAKADEQWPRSRSAVAGIATAVALGLGTLAGVAVGYLFLYGPTVIKPEYGIFWAWIGVPFYMPVGFVTGLMVAWGVYRAQMRRAELPVENEKPDLRG